MGMKLNACTMFVVTLLTLSCSAENEIKVKSLKFCNSPLKWFDAKVCGLTQDRNKTCERKNLSDEDKLLARQMAYPNTPPGIRDKKATYVGQGKRDDDWMEHATYIKDVTVTKSSDGTKADYSGRIRMAVANVGWIGSLVGVFSCSPFLSFVFVIATAVFMFAAIRQCKHAG